MSLFESVGAFFSNKPDTSKTPKPKEVVSFAEPSATTGAVVAEGGKFNQHLDFGYIGTNDSELIGRYRTIARIPDVSRAVDEIVNEILSEDSEGNIVNLNCDKVELPRATKKSLFSEFDTVLRLVDLSGDGESYLRRWYVDGKLYCHPIINKESPKDGILELRYLSPSSVSLVKEYERVVTGGIELNKTVDEYWVYDPSRKLTTATLADKTKQLLSNPRAGLQNARLKIDKRSIVSVTSGRYDDELASVVSHLHPALKVANQLSIMVDSLVIYRTARAPERRVFYVDVGNMQKQAGEQYMKDLMAKFKNQVTYDAMTGEIKDSRRNLNMMEDFWIPRREKGNATEITTLPGGQTLGQIEDIMFFREELWRALKIPKSRFSDDQGPGLVGLGRSSEITRDEIRFQKSIDRMRNRFAGFLLDLLGVQVVMKGLMAWDEWDEIRPALKLKWSQDSFFSEMKDAEILRERFTSLQIAEPFVGKWITEEQVFKKVLHLSDEDITQVKSAQKVAAKEQPEQDATEPTE